MLPLLALAAIGALGGGGLAAARGGNTGEILKGAALGGLGGSALPALAPMVGLGGASAAAGGTAGVLGTSPALGAGAGMGRMAIPALASGVPAMAAPTLPSFLTSPLGLGALGYLAGGKSGAMMGASAGAMSPESAPQLMLGALGGSAIGGPEYGQAGMALAPQLAMLKQRQQSVFGR